MKEFNSLASFSSRGLRLMISKRSSSLVYAKRILAGLSSLALSETEMSAEAVPGAVVIDQSVAGLARFAVAFNVRLERPVHKNRGRARLHSFTDLAAHPSTDSNNYWFAGSQAGPSWRLRKAVNAAGCTKLRYLDVAHIKAVNDQC